MNTNQIWICISLHFKYVIMWWKLYFTFWKLCLVQLSYKLRDFIDDICVLFVYYLQLSYAYHNNYSNCCISLFFIIIVIIFFSLSFPIFLFSSLILSTLFFYIICFLIRCNLSSLLRYCVSHIISQSCICWRRLIWTMPAA